MVDKSVASLFQKKVIAVSHELNDKLEQHCYKQKLMVIEICIDIEFVRSIATESITYIIDKGDFNVDFVGRFVDVKRTDLFVDIAKTIKAQYPDARVIFHMLGDGALWNDVKLSVKQLGVDSHVKLLGFVSNTAPYIKKMDLLLFTSDHEGLPMTLLEAMALKVPVMSRNLTTIKHVLSDGRCGYILNSDKAQVFSDKIIEVMNNTNDREEKITMAANVVNSDYSINSLIE